MSRPSSVIEEPSPELSWFSIHEQMKTIIEGYKARSMGSKGQNSSRKEVGTVSTNKTWAVMLTNDQHLPFTRINWTVQNKTARTLDTPNKGTRPTQSGRKATEIQRVLGPVRCAERAKDPHAQEIGDTI